MILLGSRERHVQASRVVEEADALVIVGAHTRQDDEVLLASLEGVHAGHLDLLVELLMQRARVLHVLDEVGALALVGRDDADLARFDARLEELGGDLLDHGRLGAIQIGRAAARDLLLAHRAVEEHGLLGLRPRKVQARYEALGGRDAVLQRAVVEDVGWKGGESRMHAILDLESNGPNAEHDEALEQRLAEAGTCRLLAHDDRAELAVVADEYELLGAEHHRHHALGLRRLCALVDQYALELILGQARIAGAHARAANDVRILHIKIKLN